MRKWLLSACAGVLLGAVILVSSGGILTAAGGKKVCAAEEVISCRMKSILKESSYLVQIMAKGEKPGEGGSGTGFVYKDNEERWSVITNDHVLGPLSNEDAWVFFEGEPTARKVKIIGRDPELDVALLEVPPSRPPRVAAAPINFSPSLEEGDVVYAAGFPFGNREVTSGYINASTLRFAHWFFASQVPLHPGNSGGPMVRFTATGEQEIIGINTMMIGAGLKSFSLHMRYVKRVLPRLRKEKIVKHSFAGLAIVDSPRGVPPFMFEEIFKTEYPPRERGVMVIGVTAPSPAASAEIKSGDIIKKLSFRGQNIPFKDRKSLEEILFFDLQPENKIEIVILRGNQELNKTLVLGVKPPPPPPPTPQNQQGGPEY
ncbi:MAG: serine protease [Parcubacteria group bacterium]|nr:serine protease [Parcubacteria group bacterium]